MDRRESDRRVAGTHCSACNKPFSEVGHGDGHWCHRCSIGRLIGEAGSHDDPLDEWRDHLSTKIMGWRQHLAEILSEINQGDSRNALLGIRLTASQMDEAARALWELQESMAHEAMVAGLEAPWDGQKG